MKHVLIVAIISGAMMFFIYAVLEESRAMQATRRACIEARGNWSNTWGGYCTFEKQPN